MKRIRFTKNELEIMITALNMAGGDYVGRTESDFSYEEANKLDESAMRKLVILQKRLEKKDQS